MPVWWNGRHKGLKIPRWQQRTGSSPVTGTIPDTAIDTIVSVAVSAFYANIAKKSEISILIIRYITYFKVSDYWVYLCIILDLFSRKIIGYRVSRNASTNLVTTTFRNAYQERGRPENLTFHSDRGKQYTSGAFTQLLQANGIRQSFSATGRPHDNAVAETFFATFKKEEAYRREYTSEQSFRKSVEQYIQFYNEVRPHQTLKYKTPQAVEEKYWAQFVENACSNSVMEQK